MTWAFSFIKHSFFAIQILVLQRFDCCIITYTAYALPVVTGNQLWDEIAGDHEVSMNKNVLCGSKAFRRQSQFRFKHVHTYMLVLFVCCTEAGPHIVLAHWAVWAKQFFDFLYKITTQVRGRFCKSKTKILYKLPLLNSWISAEKTVKNDSAIWTPFWKLIRMTSRVKPLVLNYSLLAQLRHNIVSNMAGIASLLVAFFFLICPWCLSKTPVIPPNHQLRNENWDRILKGEWMVKL